MDPDDQARLRRLTRVTTVGMGALFIEGVLMALLWSDGSSSVRRWLVVGLILASALTFVPLAMAQLAIWKKR
jgi:hypothetical protein